MKLATAAAAAGVVGRAVPKTTPTAAVVVVLGVRVRQTSKLCLSPLMWTAQVCLCREQCHCSTLAWLVAIAASKGAPQRSE